MSATLARGHGGDGSSDDPSCPHPHPIDIGGKNNHRKKRSIVTGTSLMSKSDRTLNDATPRINVAKEVVSPDVVDDSMEMEKLSPVVTIMYRTHHYLRRRVAYTVVANYVRNTWGKYGLVRSMFSSSTGLFSFQFSSMEGLDAMLENGLWFIRNNPLSLRKWHPDENLLKEDVSTIPVWVKLYSVLVTAFSEDGLSAITTKLGTPIMLDSYTVDMCMQSWGRSSYAKAMIKLRADVELKDNIVAAMPKITREGYRISKIITQ
ncbi:beta-caryophyllene synthase [Tanacetum coccineum]